MNCNIIKSNNSSIIDIGCEMLSCNHLSMSTKIRNFREFFGSNRAAVKCWVCMTQHYKESTLSKHKMLFALYYLKRNPTNGEAANYLKCHSQTYIFWRDTYLTYICNLPVVRNVNV